MLCLKCFRVNDSEPPPEFVEVDWFKSNRRCDGLIGGFQAAMSTLPVPACDPNRRLVEAIEPPESRRSG